MPSNDGFSIQSLLPYRLYHISAIHERIVYANMTRDTGVTLPEWRIMGNVASGINTFTALQKELLVDQGQLSNSIKQLQHKGLLQKHKSNVDRRQTILSLTEQGVQKKTVIKDMAANYEVIALQKLSAEDVRVLDKALAVVERNLKAFWESHQ